MPVLSLRRAEIDAMCRQASGKSLEEIEAGIDAEGTPRSFELTGWRLVAETNVTRKEVKTQNVVAVLEGAGALAEETVIIGAHYDHLGYGGMGSLARGSKEIHNGADDNASGTTGLLEVARRLVEASKGDGPRRRIVFIAFSAEEIGLVGSARHAREPLYPMDRTVAMLNMDMIGRLSENKLIIQGVDTAKAWGGMIDRLNETYRFELTRQTGGFGPSDHASFYAQRVPVMHFFTGLHADYHRPADDTPALNLEGMQRIVGMVTDCAVEIMQAEARPEYVNIPRAGRGDPASGDRPYFGSIPDFAQEKPGLTLSGVAEDGPAAKAGLKGGDRIIQIGDAKIGNLEDFDAVLRRYKPGDKAKVVFVREGQEMTVEATFGKR
jgi:hypothetical protein